MCVFVVKGMWGLEMDGERTGSDVFADTSAIHELLATECEALSSHQLGWQTLDQSLPFGITSFCYHSWAAIDMKEFKRTLSPVMTCCAIDTLDCPTSNLAALFNGFLDLLSSLALEYAILASQFAVNISCLGLNCVHGIC